MTSESVIFTQKLKEATQLANTLFGKKALHASVRLLYR